MKKTTWILLGVLTAVLAACSDDPVSGPSGGDDLLTNCELNQTFLADGGVGRDGIPSLTDPPTATPGSPGLSYLRDEDRVVGILVNGQAYAVPHNVLWWHEIVNLNAGGEELAVTLCPLTGTSLAFDRSSIGGDELGVSGLLFKANLIMFNRGDPESLWPQMLGEARCGGEVGTALERYPAVEMTWGAWRDLHSNTLAITEVTGHDRDYQRYPYGDYEDLNNNSFLGFPMPDLDPRHPPKERVIGLPPTDGEEEGMAFPFGELHGVEGTHAVVDFMWREEPAVVLWSDEARGGTVYRPVTRDGDPVTLTSDAGGITDQETGSRWSVDGRAVDGEMAGSALVPVEEAYPAFWGAWSAFFPDTGLWTG